MKIITYGWQILNEIKSKMNECEANTGSKDLFSETMKLELTSHSSNIRKIDKKCIKHVF